MEVETGEVKEHPTYKRIQEYPIAHAVKLADLQHNSDLSRVDHVDENALKRKIF
mgnify:CR=1 FL=1